MKRVTLKDTHVTVFQYNETQAAYIPVAEYGTENTAQLEALAETLDASEYVTVERHTISRTGKITFDRVAVDVILTGYKPRVLHGRDE